MNPVPPVALPPQVRAILYYITALGGLAFGTTQSIFLAMQLPQPIWLTVTGLVLGFLGTAFGITAASNTKIPATTPTDVDP